MKKSVQNMPIIVCGISHKTAPIDLREKAFFAADKIPFYLQDLLANENVREAVLLSTCNRSELYCEADNIEKITEWFCRQHPIAASDLLKILYIKEDQAAVQHIMQVACGLDSMVLGEPQILGQMKEAFSESVAAGSVGNLFHRLFQQIFAVAKEVRTNTSVGACPVSIASAAIRLLKTETTLENKSILLLGAGDTIQLALKYLHQVNAKNIFIVNRSFENAKLLAEKFQTQALDFSQLKNALDDADICISATNSAQPLITKTMLIDRNKTIHLVDLAVPRDIEHDVAVLSNVKLFSIDNLKNVIQHNRKGREHAASKAEEMIVEKTKNFMHWLRSVDEVATTISAYRQQIEILCKNELAKFQKQLARGEDPSLVLNHFAAALTNKLLHHPSVQLRQAGVEGRFDLLELARELFALPQPEVELS